MQLSDPISATPAALLAAYDQQLRGAASLATVPSVQVAIEDTVLRAVGLHPQGMVIASGLETMDAVAFDRLIARQVEVFSELQQPFEWKTWSHDHPGEFMSRLESFGFVRGDTETVMIARVDDVDLDLAPPPGVRLRTVTSAAEFARLATLWAAVWDEDMGEMADACRAAVEAFPSAVTVLAAEVGTQWVSSARAEFVEGTGFCTLWGGSTLPEWRGRGIYRALVSRRARLAADRGYTFLEVDALPTSRPILERLGFVAVTTTTPFQWSPPSADTTAPHDG
ncbi:MAG: GNAT family N-acetyltransferase [Candidatus Dormibacteria bacterium]